MKTPPVRSSSHDAGVAETKTVWGRIASHSSNFKGRLSRHEGRRKPCSARVGFADQIALRHAADLGDGDVALVDEEKRLLGDVLEAGRRRLGRWRGRRDGAE